MFMKGYHQRKLQGLPEGDKPVTSGGRRREKAWERQTRTARGLSLGNVQEEPENQRIDREGHNTGKIKMKGSTYKV